MPQLERIAWLTAALSAAVFGFAIAADAQTPANIPLQDLQIRAKAGDRTATRQLAEAYYLGKGVEQDFKIASQWYEKLAKQGDVRAQTSLGLMFARGYFISKGKASPRIFLRPRNGTCRQPCAVTCRRNPIWV